MLSRNYRKKTLKERIIIISVASVLFIASFVLNIVACTAVYDYDLNVVPILQDNQVLGSKGFMIFMNLVSVVFDPMICAAYTFLIYLISFRKLQIIAFLIWFFFLSWLLGILKMAIHQPRPFWIVGSEVQMESWTCYMDYGCPSGHSMLAIVILQFFVRFYSRVHKCVYNYIGFFYLLIFIIELLVMFSRMMLGMHTLNQVLFGLSIGLFSLIPYYLFIENFIMEMLLKIFVNPGSKVTNICCLIVAIFCFAVQIMLAILPEYPTLQYYDKVKKIDGCTKVKQYKSFQYSCLIGTSIISAGFGAILGLNYLKRPYNLTKLLSYTRISVKFIGRFLLTIVFGAIPLVIFLNPLWDKIDIPNQGKAMLEWGLSNLAFFFAVFFIVYLTPIAGQKIGIQAYKHPKSYKQFKQFQSIDILQLQQNQFEGFRIKPRQTELTEPAMYSAQAKLN